MENKDIARVFKLCAKLMELHEENSFRTRAMSTAAFRIEKLPFPARTADLETLSQQDKIGKSTAEKIIQVVTSGTFPELDALLAKTPAGVLELLQIKGLGPKKVLTIWKTLDIESVGELFYACNENRLIEAKGFGLKTQEEIKKAIEFSMASQGLFHWAKVAGPAEEVHNALHQALPDCSISFTGAYRRKTEILDKIEILIAAAPSVVEQAIRSLDFEFDIHIDAATITFRDKDGVPFEVSSCTRQDFAKTLLMTTGSESHLAGLEKRASIPALETEEKIYRALKMDYIEPELREGNQEIEWAESGKLPTLIQYSDLKGTLHNHSTYSDGVNTLEEMARFCKETLQLEYLGICDHSKTAVYAGGLTIEEVEAQWQEIDVLNEKLSPFKIFKGIESDILSDGGLDYPNDILAGFDFVVASIHSGLKMDSDRATQRLIKAIENPYTTILGHPTGRLLLSRAGYPIDYKKVIDACAANQVIIEINANPLRLDLDWRWHQYALEKGVRLAINPDAHRTAGFYDMHHGVQVARKGGLTAKQCLNALTLDEISAYFQTRKATYSP
ncbi:MAG TPA: DNA polymerase/3'-5' exonuclease PolX [Candidatus Sphingobacterium stercorigallinarum]|nr:DNA polymerase/3'-5' exonuclease PolX [Candidatus Sphingobacterium stercorigallinarum]